MDPKPYKKFMYPVKRIPALVDQYMNDRKIPPLYSSNPLFVDEYYFDNTGALIPQHIPLGELPNPQDTYYKQNLCYFNNKCPTDTMYYNYDSRGKQVRK